HDSTGQSGRMPLLQEGDRIARVDVVGTFEVVVPDGSRRNAQSVINGGGHVFGPLGGAGGIGPVLIRGANHVSAADSAAGEKYRLHGPPVVASRACERIGERRNLWRAAEFACHYDQRAGQQSPGSEVVEQRRQGPVGRRKELVLE